MWTNQCNNMKQSNTNLTSGHVQTSLTVYYRVLDVIALYCCCYCVHSLLLCAEIKVKQFERGDNLKAVFSPLLQRLCFNISVVETCRYFMLKLSF